MLSTLRGDDRGNEAADGRMKVERRKLAEALVARAACVCVEAGAIGLP